MPTQDDVMHSAAKPSGWALPLMVMVLFAGLLLASERIDFHPDEAIYFASIPVELRSDSGLFFNLAYGIAWELQSIRLARAISCAFAAGTFFLTAKLMLVNREDNPRILSIIFFVFAVSYSVIFHGARVRPEISWIFTACGCLLMLAYYERTRSPKCAAIASLCVFITGMNHKLAWFAIAFIIAYCCILIVVKPRARFGMLLVAVAAIAGPIANQILRAIWLDIDCMSAIAALAAKPEAKAQTLYQFSRFALEDAGIFLADQAANRGFVQYLLSTDDAHYSNYYLLNSSLIVSIALPILSSTRRELFIYAFPSFFLACCFATGYYNPTYAPMLLHYNIVCCAYVLTARNLSSLAARARAFASMVVVAYVGFLSISFISTRVIWHGAAYTFDQFSSVREEANNQYERGAKSFAVSERFINAVPKGAHTSVLFKDDLDFASVDVIIYDDYDAYMYGFVSDASARKARILNFIQTQCVLQSQSYAVYPQGQQYERIDRPGSWFFRHSVGGRLTVAKKCG